LVLIAKGSNTRYFLDNFTSSNHVVLNPDIELASYSLVNEFVEIGFGIGYLVKEFISDKLDSGELFEVKVKPEIPSREIGLVYSSNKSLSMSASKFIDLLKHK